VTAICQECGWLIKDESLGYCPHCAPARVKAERKQAEATAMEAVLLSTTFVLPGRRISESLGIVGAEYVMSTNIFVDWAAGIRDVVGGRSESYQRELRTAREECLRELRREALALNADGVVGVNFNYSEISGGGKSMLFMVVNGTAVKSVART